LCYDNGTGATKDSVQAYALLNLAGISDHQARESRDALEKIMPQSQIAEGQRRTKELQAEFAKSKSQ